MPHYRYLTQRDILRAGDEYHQCGRGRNALWVLVSRHNHGKRKGEVFCHATRVRRKRMGEEE